MRALPTAVCLLLLSGCGAATDAPLTAADARSKLGVKDRALTQLATTELTAITQRAQEWAAANSGSMAGFANDLKATQPSVAGTAAVLSDTSVSVATAGGRCLVAALPAGAPTESACAGATRP